MKKILIVEDSVFDKAMIKNLVQSMENYEIVAMVENPEISELICLRKIVDIIIMDICGKDNSSGLKSAAKIKKSNPEIKIVISTSMPDYTFIKKAMEAGCESFWYKNENINELRNIIEKTMAGGSVYPNETPIVKIGNVTSDKFSDKELKIITKMADGKSYQQIADEMGISIDTVRHYVKTIYSKTGIHSNIQLIGACIMNQLILPGY